MFSWICFRVIKLLLVGNQRKYFMSWRFSILDRESKVSEYRTPLGMIECRNLASIVKLYGQVFGSELSPHGIFFLLQEFIPWFFELQCLYWREGWSVLSSDKPVGLNVFTKRLRAEVVRQNKQEQVTQAPQFLNRTPFVGCLLLRKNFWPAGKKVLCYWKSSWAGGSSISNIGLENSKNQIMNSTLETRKLNRHATAWSFTSRVMSPNPSPATIMPRIQKQISPPHITSNWIFRFHSCLSSNRNSSIWVVCCMHIGTIYYVAR